MYLSLDDPFHKRNRFPATFNKNSTYLESRAGIFFEQEKFQVTNYSFPVVNLQLLVVVQD